MNSKVIDKQIIIDNICYTELVYRRINKKIGVTYSKVQIVKLILKLLTESSVTSYIRTGKNYYISNFENKIRVTINSNSFRIITVNKII